MGRHLGEEPIARPEYTQKALATVRCQPRLAGFAGGGRIVRSTCLSILSPLLASNT